MRPHPPWLLLPVLAVPVAAQAEPGGEGDRATLQGTLRPAGVLDLDVRLRLGRTVDGKPEWLPAGVKGFPVGDDGRFRVQGLPPGRWKVYLEANFPIQGFVNPLSLFGVAQARPHLAEVTLTGGKATSVELDAGRFAPATVRGKVMLDDRPLEGVEAGLQGRQLRPEFNGSVEYAIGPFRLGDGGAFAEQLILPGQYRVAVRIREPESGAPALRWSDWFEVGPGAKLDRVYRVLARRLRVRLLDAEGEPARDRKVVVMVGGRIERIVTTDAEGILVLENAPTEAATLRPTGSALFAVVQMPLGKKEAEVEARLGK